MSTWRRHRAQRNSRASSIAPPGGEGWTIRDHRAILHSEPYARADLGAASDVTAKSVQSEAASASSPTPISHQLTSDVIAGTRGARLLWQAASAQGGNNDTSQAGAVGRFSAGSLRPAQSVHEGCSPNNRAFPQPPTPPTPGSSWATAMPWSRSCSAGPTPESMSSWGEWKAPAARMTSRSARRVPDPPLHDARAHHHAGRRTLSVCRNDAAPHSYWHRHVSERATVARPIMNRSGFPETSV